MKSIFFSGVVRQLRPQVSAVTSIAVLLLIWDVMGNNYLDLPVLSLPTLPFTLSSPALGLLLVFRTNAAYFRWMSGRDAWARMIIHCKNLVRMASVFSTDVEAVEEFSKVVWLYCRTVMNKLSSPDEDEEVYKEQVQEVFRSSLIGEKVISSSDRVVCAWKQMSIQLHSLPSTDPKALIETDKSIIILGECTAICEKIYSSPVPLVYTRHTARYLSVFALLLPFALYSSFSSEGEILFLIPASAIIGFFLFGVDELGELQIYSSLCNSHLHTTYSSLPFLSHNTAMQLEEPFSILPLQVFCDEIYESNKLMVDKDDSIKEQSQVSM